MDRFLKKEFATSKILKRPDPKDLATQKKGKTILNIDKNESVKQKSVDKVKNNLSDMLNHVIPSQIHSQDGFKMDIEEEKSTPVKKILKIKKSNKLSDQVEVLSKGKSYANKLREEKEEEEEVDSVPQRKSRERVTPLKRAANTRNKSPQEIELDEDYQNESQSSLKKGIKKLKLTRLSEKPKKANVKITAKDKCLIEEKKVNRFSESESDTYSEDNEKGHVEFVEGEGDNFLANHKFNKSSKKDDGMKQKTLKFEKTKLAAQKAQETQQKVSIDSFLPMKITQSEFKEEEEMVEFNEDNDDDELLSDEERIKQIDLMLSEKKRKEQEQKEDQEADNDDDEEMQKNIEKENSDHEHYEIKQSETLKDTKTEKISTPKAAETINYDEVSNHKDDAVDDGAIEDTDFVTQMRGKYFTVNGKPTEEGVNILVLDNFIKRNGGCITNTINKKLNYMIVCGKEVNKQKKQYAAELNVKILTEEEFIQVLLEQHNCDLKELINIYTAVLAQHSSPQKTTAAPAVHATQSNVSNQTSSVVVAQKSSFASSSCPQTQEQPIFQKQQKQPSSNNQVKKQPAQLPSNLLSQWIPQSTLSATESNEMITDTYETKPHVSPKVQAKKPRKAIQEIECEEIELEIETEKPAQKSINEPAKKIIKQEKIKSETPMNHQPKQSLNQLWTHKYAPSSLRDCVGNREQIQKIKSWLENWENVVIHKQYSSQSNWKMNPNARACLISGPPGIGKTTTVRLLAQQLGMSLIEWNASDVRNKAAIETIVNPLRNNQVLNQQGQLGGTDGKQRSIILMDEVDGMSTGDIGGNQTLIKIIKDTQNPIFCVCNDRYSQKLRSLAGVCFDVRFQKPTNMEVADRLASVCNREGIVFDIKTLQMLSEGASQDIRQSLNLLQMQAKKSKTLQSNMFVETQSFKKDSSVSLNIFDATKILATRSLFHKMDISEKQDLFFLDYEIMPLMIQENYLNQNFDYRTSLQELQNIATAAQVIAESDIIGNSIRSKGNWSLLQDQGFLSSAYVPNVVCRNSFEKVQMTQFLGKMSSQRKTNRLIRELRTAMSEHISGNRMAAYLDYAEPIMELILHYLQEDGKDGVNSVLNIMENYCITPEILKEHLVVLNMNKTIEERLKNIPTAVKTALTKAYNKRFKDDVKPEKKKERPEEDADQVLESLEDNEKRQEEDNSPVNQENTTDGNEEQQQDQNVLIQEEEDNEEKNSKNLLKLKPKATKSAAGTVKQPISKANSSKSVSSQGSIQFKKINKK